MTLSDNDKYNRTLFVFHVSAN